MKVKDDLKGIGAVYHFNAGKDVSINYIDVNTILKGVTPHWHGKSIPKRDEFDWSLEWFDPRNKKSLKQTTINFGKKYIGWHVCMDMSKNTCQVVFYRKKLFKVGMRRPIYSS